MKKSTVFCAALLGTLAAPAFADGFRYVGGEAGWAYVGYSNAKTRDDAKTRDQVMRERVEFSRNPVTADGWKWAGGEAGWLFVGERVSRQQHNVAADTR